MKPRWRWVTASTVILVAGLSVSVWLTRDSGDEGQRIELSAPTNRFLIPTALPQVSPPSVTSNGRLTAAYPGDADYLEREHLRSIQLERLRSDLLKAEAIWRARRPRSYEFTVSVFGFSEGFPMSYRVDGDRPYLKDYLPDLVPVITDQGDETIDRLFVKLKQYLRRKPFRANIHFDPDFGFPASGGFEDDANATDDEWGFKVSEFKVVDSK